MADDIVAIGGSGAAERFEDLFRAEYQNVLTAYGCSERQAQQAFLRLWRRRWLVRDTPAAARYLRRDARGLARAPSAVDVDRAWLEFQRLRSRGRRRLALGAAGVAAVVLIAGGALDLAGRVSPERPASFRPRAVARPPRIPPSDPGAVAARVPVSGVYGLAAASGQVWAIRSYGVRQVSVQLVRIDVRTNTIGRRIRLAWQPGSIAAGAGMVWLTTPFGGQRGQVDRIDAATGRPVGVLHLPVGRCLQVIYGAGSLWAGCEARGPNAVAFLRIDPATGRVAWRSALVHGAVSPGQYGPVLASMAAAPDGLWYATSSGVAAFAGPGLLPVSVRPPPYTINLNVTTTLVYSQGFIWAMAGDDGSVAKIDPVTGRVLRIYTFYSYLSGQGLSLAVAQGSLWLLDNQDFQYPSVLQVSIATGVPTGRVGGRQLCGGQPYCSLIFATPGAIWVPGPTWLTRIDPARLIGPRSAPSAIALLKKSRPTSGSRSASRSRSRPRSRASTGSRDRAAPARP